MDQGESIIVVGQQEPAPGGAQRELTRGCIVPCGATLPPPCPGVRHVRVPRLGIVIADDELRRRIDRYFHYPMIVLALLTLPLLILDYMYIQEAAASQATARDWKWWLTISGLTLIWLAFLVEFIVKIAVAECRIEYVKRNWLDLVIIVIPLLRPLRAAAVARTTRVFTLRGVGFKFCRYVFTLIVGLEATDRVLQRLGWKAGPGRREPEKMTRFELMAEVRRLRRLNDQWQSWHRAEQEYLSAHRREPFKAAAPNSDAPSKAQA